MGLMRRTLSKKGGVTEKRRFEVSMKNTRTWSELGTLINDRATNKRQARKKKSLTALVTKKKTNIITGKGKFIDVLDRQQTPALENQQKGKGQ